MSSWQSRVDDFTRATESYASYGPGPMSEEQVENAARMMLEEILELLATQKSVADAVQFTVSTAQTLATKVKPKHDLDPIPKIGEQADALVDVSYYALNISGRKGWNLDPLFDEVHAANMRKVDPATGKCLRDANGKILKPEGWVGPDVESVVPSILGNPHP